GSRAVRFPRPQAVPPHHQESLEPRTCASATRKLRRTGSHYGRIPIQRTPRLRPPARSPRKPGAFRFSIASVRPVIGSREQALATGPCGLYRLPKYPKPLKISYGLRTVLVPSSKLSLRRTPLVPALLM